MGKQVTYKTCGGIFSHTSGNPAAKLLRESEKVQAVQWHWACWNHAVLDTATSPLVLGCWGWQWESAIRRQARSQFCVTVGSWIFIVCVSCSCGPVCHATEQPHAVHTTYLVHRCHLLMSNSELAPMFCTNCLPPCLTTTTLTESYHVTYHMRPHQPIIDQQGLGLRGLVHKEAHPVIPDLH